MNKLEIKQKLTSSHQRLIDCISALSAEEFLHSNNEKWTAGQQLEHIIKSVEPLVGAFKFPRTILEQQFGVSDSAGESFDGIVEKYKKQLESGAKATEKFIPRAVAVEQQANMGERLEKLIVDLNEATDDFEESELDKYLLPHPLLKNLTLREMLYFTIYHVEHHLEQTVINLK